MSLLDKSIGRSLLAQLASSGPRQAEALRWPSVLGRPRIDLELTIDGERAMSETTCTWAGAHVLTVHTAVPRADLALELHSTFVGQSGVDTHVVHLRLGPPG